MLYYAMQEAISQSSCPTTQKMRSRSMTDRIGQRLGNYRLTRLLRQGSFAQGYLVSVPSSGSRKDLDSCSLPLGKVYSPNPSRSSGNALGEHTLLKTNTAS